MAMVKAVGDRHAYITSGSTNQIKTGRGRLHRIILNKPVASSTITIIDGTSGTTANIGVITNTSAVEPYQMEYGIIFHAGLRIITSGADDVTVVYD
jgi:hypothetical protein